MTWNGPLDESASLLEGWHWGRGWSIREKCCHCVGSPALCTYYGDCSKHLEIMKGVAMDTEPYPVFAGLLIRKAVTW